METDCYLGIIIGKGKNVEQKLMQDFHEACVSWQGKEWDPLGKVTLVNAYCVGKLAYAAPFLTITSAKINKLVGDYWNVIWLCKAFCLNQSDTAVDREEGGMGGLQLRL